MRESRGVKCVSVILSTFLQEKFMQCGSAGLLKSGCKCIEIARKTKTFSIPLSNDIAIPCGLKFLRVFNFADVDFSSWISNITPGNIFCGFHVQYLRVTETKALYKTVCNHWNSACQVNKGSRFLQIFWAGVCFHRS